MVALLLRLDVSGVAIFIYISFQAPHCLIMTIYKHRITEVQSESGEIFQTGQKKWLIVNYDSYCQKQIWEHPPRVMRRRIGWYVCHPCPGCSRFRMAAFSLIESLGGYGGQKTLSPSTHVFGTISFAPLLNCTTHHWVIFYFFFKGRGFERLYRKQSTPKLTYEVINRWTECINWL